MSESTSGSSTLGLLRASFLGAFLIALGVCIRWNHVHRRHCKDIECKLEEGRGDDQDVRSKVKGTMASMPAKIKRTVDHKPRQPM